MKKRKVMPKLLNLTLLLLLLTSCRIKNDGSVLIPQIRTANINSDNYTLPLSKERLNAFVNGKRSFIVYVMSPTCTPCKKLSPRLQYYVSKTKTEIYKLDITTDEYKTNAAYYIETLDLNVTPTLLIFNNGKVNKREEGISKFDSNEAVINYFGNIIKRGSFFVSDLSLSIPSRKKGAIFTFDFNDEHALLMFTETFYPLISEHDYLTYLIDDKTTPNNFLLTFTNNENSFALNFPYINSEEVVTPFLSYFT